MIHTTLTLTKKSKIKTTFMPCNFKMETFITERSLGLYTKVNMKTLVCLGRDAICSISDDTSRMGPNMETKPCI